MPRLEGPPAPKVGPGSSMPAGVHAKRRKKKVVARRVAALLPQPQDSSLAFIDDLKTPALKKANVVSTVKKKVRKNRPVVREDSSEDEIAPARLAITKTSNNAKSAKKNKKIQSHASKTSEKIVEEHPSVSSKKKEASKGSKKTKRKDSPSSPSAAKRKAPPPALTPTTTTSDQHKVPAVTAQKPAASSVASPSVTEQLPRQDLPPPNRCAMYFDTRFLDTTPVREIGTKLVDEYELFLASLDSRGACPHILASSIQKANAKKNSRRNVVAVQMGHWQNGIYHLANGQCDEEGLPSTWITPPPTKNTNMNENQKGVPCPKPLLAHDSWKHFGETIESILEEDRRIRGTVKKLRPLDITLVTNDVSFFCDVNDGSHKRAVGRFWDLVKPFFQDLSIRTIHIVVTKTGTVALARPVPDANESKDNSPPSPMDVEGTEAMEIDEEPTRKNDVEARTMHEVSIANCIRVIEVQLKVKAQHDDKLYRSYKEPVAPVDISISLIDATANTRLGFKSLLRRCLRDTVESVSASVLHASFSLNKTTAVTSTPTNRIHLKLPETVEGRDHSVSFDIKYKTVPFALDRPVSTNGFFVDLKELSACKLEIQQLVPLVCVDATLLFGVPMDVQASVEGEYDQYQELLVLVRSLFRTMREKQVAMLLRIADDYDEASGENEEEEEGNKGVFHNPKRGQVFLLMAEEKVGVPSASSIGSGVLFRYASADELLLEAEKRESKIDATLMTEEVVKDYEAYVENALDLLDCQAVNPLYLDATTKSVPSANSKTIAAWTSPQLKTEDSRWNDNSGVGALAESDDDDGMSVDEDDSVRNCGFDYAYLASQDQPEE